MQVMFLVGYPASFAFFMVLYLSYISSLWNVFLYGTANYVFSVALLALHSACLLCCIAGTAS